MINSKPQATPMVPKGNDIPNPNLERINNVPYREAGSLLYLATTTRPDITYAVNILSRSQMEPTENDWRHVKRVFRYLKGTMNLGLVYSALEMYRSFKT